MRACKQTQCCYLKMAGCPECPECGAKPCEVSENDLCIECYCCEKDLGYMRGGIPSDVKEAIKQVIQQEQEKQQKEQPMVVEIKNE